MRAKDTARTLATRYAPSMLRGFRVARQFLWNSLASVDSTFDEIYRKNAWGNAESRSGPGSTSHATRSISESLAALVKELEVRTLVDAPCGDFWMRRAQLELESYVGVDVVQQIINDNNRMYSSARHSFVKLDLTRQPLPRADLIVCRDLLIHLSYRHVFDVIRNFKRSGSKYVLCTNNPDHSFNHDIMTGSFRPLNLCIEPFGLPPPNRELSDDPPPDSIPEGATRKTMALWWLQDIKLG